MDELRTFLSSKKNLANLMTLLVLILGLPLGVNLVRQQQILRSRAGNDPIVITGDSVETRDGVLISHSSKVTLRLSSTLGPPQGTASLYRQSTIASNSLVSVVRAANSTDTGGACHYTEDCQSFDDPLGRGKFSGGKHSCTGITNDQGVCVYSGDISTTTCQNSQDATLRVEGCGGTPDFDNQDKTHKWMVTIKRDCSGNLTGYENLTDEGPREECGGNPSFLCTNGVTIGGKACAPELSNGQNNVYRICGEKSGPVESPQYGDPHTCPDGQICKSDSAGVRCEAAGGGGNSNQCYLCDSGNWRQAGGSYKDQASCESHQGYKWTSAKPDWCIPPAASQLVTINVGGACAGHTSQEILAPHKTDGTNAPDDIASSYLRSDSFDGKTTGDIPDNVKKELVDGLKNGTYFLYHFGENRQLTGGGAESDVSSFYLRSDSPSWSGGRSATDNELLYPSSQIEQNLFNFVNSGDLYVIKPDGTVLCGQKKTQPAENPGACYFCDGGTWKQTSQQFTATDCNSRPGYSTNASTPATCTNSSGNNGGSGGSSGGGGNGGNGGTAASPRTVSFKVALTQAGLATANAIPYLHEPQSYDLDFVTPTDPTPTGPKKVFVQFLGKNAAGQDVTSDPLSANVTLVGPDPVITSAQCSPDITNSGTTVTLTGSNFGDAGNQGTVTADGGQTTITSWQTGTVVASLPTQAQRGKIFKIFLARKDGSKNKDAFNCPVNVSGLAVQTNQFCTAISGSSTENVVMTLAENRNGAEKIRKVVSFDKDGNVLGLDTAKLDPTKQYKVCFKPPLGLRRCTTFNPTGGLTLLSNLTLPIGDICPAGGDGKVNSLDKACLNQQWGKVTSGARSGDFDHNGVVNARDWGCQVRFFNQEDDPDLDGPIAANQ